MTAPALQLAAAAARTPYVPTSQLPDSERKAAWLAARKICLTGTDAGKILTGKGFDVWLEKMGKAEAWNDDEIPDYVRAGNYYERGSLAWYADRHQVALQFADSYQFIRHPNPALPIGATLDARRMDNGAPVDAKFLHRWSPYDAETGTGWGAPGTGQVPVLYATQVLVQAIVLDAPYGDLAPFFRVDGEFATFRVERDATQEARLLAFLAGWWDRHIVQGEQPAIGSSEGATDYLKMLPRATDVIRKATPEEEALLLEWTIARDTFDAAEADKDRLGNLVRDAIGADAGIIGKSYGATHKAPAASKKPDHEAIAKALLAELTKRCGPDVAGKVYGDALDAHTRTVQQGRKLLHKTTK